MTSSSNDVKELRAIPEWSPNVACLTAWPAHEYAWGVHLRAAQREFVGFCSALLSEPRSESIDLLVADSAGELEARRELAAFGERVHFRRIPYGDVWLRDTSPIFVDQGGKPSAVRFKFNGWGAKYEYPTDDSLAERLSNVYKVPCKPYSLILEGGAIELDGEGLCLTTESCLLNENRGTDATPASRARAERILMEAFGATKVLWLGEGLAGDHTDGHVDNIARFVGPGAVVHMRSLRDDDPNAEVLETIEKDLRAMRDAHGNPLTLHTIPSVGRVEGTDGSIIAASYCNFYLGNAVVVMPAFGTEDDERARAALAQVFPKHTVIASSARAFLEGGGTFHCMTRQVPALLGELGAHSR